MCYNINGTYRISSINHAFNEHVKFVLIPHLFPYFVFASKDCHCAGLSEPLLIYIMCWLISILEVDQVDTQAFKWGHWNDKSINFKILI